MLKTVFFSVCIKVIDTIFSTIKMKSFIVELNHLGPSFYFVKPSSVAFSKLNRNNELVNHKLKYAANILRNVNRAKIYIGT